MYYYEAETKTMLVIRLSAMGDAAMTVPVLHSLLREYPDLCVVMLTTYGYDPMFDNLPGIHIVHFDRHGKDKGLRGVFRVWKKLRKTYTFDYVADLHNVLRSRLLTFLIDLTTKGVRIEHIDKGREEKKALVRNGYKKSHQLKSSFERYHDVFTKLGYNFSLDFTSIFKKEQEIPADMLEGFGTKGDTPWVGIAPFAGHRSKILPMKRMEEVVSKLNDEGMTILLFGHGKNEKTVLYGWQKKYEHVHAMPPSTYLPQELALMSHLDAMVSMDSANMHLASMVGTPVVSIWGATHPYAGFMGWKQSEENAVQLPLDCRPCSVYGNRHCPMDRNYECIRTIGPDAIVEKIKKVINEKKKAGQTQD